MEKAAGEGKTPSGSARRPISQPTPPNVPPAGPSNMPFPFSPPFPSDDPGRLPHASTTSSLPSQLGLGFGGGRIGGRFQDGFRWGGRSTGRGRMSVPYSRHCGNNRVDNVNGIDDSPTVDLAREKRRREQEPLTTMDYPTQTQDLLNQLQPLILPHQNWNFSDWSQPGWPSRPIFPCGGQQTWSPSINLLETFPGGATFPGAPLPRTLLPHGWDFNYPLGQDYIRIGNSNWLHIDRNDNPTSVVKADEIVNLWSATEDELYRANQKNAELKEQIRALNVENQKLSDTVEENKALIARLKSMLPLTEGSASSVSGLPNTEKGHGDEE